MLLSVNSTYRYFHLINCGSKMVHYCTKTVGMQGQIKDKLFSSSPFGHGVPCAASRLLTT